MINSTEACYLINSAVTFSFGTLFEYIDRIRQNYQNKADGIHGLIVVLYMYVVNTEIYTVYITCQKDENIEEKVFKVYMYIVYGKEHKENKLKKIKKKKERTRQDEERTDRQRQLPKKKKHLILTFSFCFFFFGHFRFTNNNAKLIHLMVD